MAAAAVDELAERHESALHSREFGEALKRHLGMEEEQTTSVMIAQYWRQVTNDVTEAEVEIQNERC